MVLAKALVFMVHFLPVIMLAKLRIKKLPSLGIEAFVFDALEHFI